MRHQTTEHTDLARVSGLGEQAGRGLRERFERLGIGEPADVGQRLAGTGDRRLADIGGEQQVAREMLVACRGEDAVDLGRGVRRGERGARARDRRVHLQEMGEHAVAERVMDDPLGGLRAARR